MLGRPQEKGRSSLADLFGSGPVGSPEVMNVTSCYVETRDGSPERIANHLLVTDSHQQMLGRQYIK